MRSIQLLVAYVLSAAVLLGQEAAPQLPLISVTGTHEIEIAPDEIQITVDIDNRDKLLQVAKDKTDAQAKTLIALAKAAQIDPKDIVTSYVAVDPARSYKKNLGRTILYFRAAQRVTITVRDFSKYEPLMDQLIKEGFGQAYVEYAVSDLPAYRKKARVGAILAAQEKAKLLAESVGQKIGKAYSIKEVDLSNRSNMRANTYLNTMSESRTDEDDDAAGPLSVGNISVTVSVEVSFLLE